ncbi:MAG: class I SAM-dependent methyltransferase [Nitrospirae bacterium]|nr:class I SAM-dependent methyltransferase [Nitrospirota bacterium]
MHEIEDMEQNFWDELYEIEPEHFGTGESEFAIKCSKMMRDSGINKVLEIGCGYGRDSLFFASQGFKVVAMDYSTKALDILNEKLSVDSASKKIEAIHCDICKGIPFGDGYFDAVYSFLLFPVGFSNSQIEFVFSEIHRVLRNNGLFLSCVRNDVEAISFFNKGYLYSRLAGFQVDSLINRTISVGKYQFNVIEFFAKKGGAKWERLNNRLM